MSFLEKIMGVLLVVGLPALGLLTALQPFGRLYLASTCVFVSLFFLCFHLAMDGADGPVGFVIGMYFGFVGAAFLLAHATKYTVAMLKLLFRVLYLEPKSRVAKAPGEV